MSPELKFMMFLVIVLQGIMIYFAILEDRKIPYERHCGKRPRRMNPPGETMGRNNSVRIWPWHVSILSQPNASVPFSQICSGTIIHKYWILTAAACVNEIKNPFNRTLLIRAGSRRLDVDDETTQQSEVAKIVIHKKFNPDTLRYNIALLKLETPFMLNGSLYPICVPDKAATDHKYVSCYIAGHNVQPGDDFGVLQVANVSGWARSTCNVPEIWNYTVSVDMLCAGSFAAGGKACEKNLGGAFMCYISNEQAYFIIGIRVKTATCGVVQRPDIYLDVSSHFYWIQFRLLDD